jgi:4-aminobutyrate aminotransferase
MQNAQELGEYTLDALTEIMTRHTTIGEVRGKGLMIGVEMVKDRESKEPAGELRDAVIEGAFKRGLIGLGSGKSSIRLAPPLNISRELIDEGLMILEDALTEVESSA